MTKDKAIEIFVRRYFKLLKAQEDFKKKEYDELKKNYFGTDLKYQFQNPKDREIADVLLRMMIRSQGIPDADALQFIIDETPFLRLCNVKGQEYSGEIARVSDAYRAKNELQSFNDLEKFEKLQAKARAAATIEIEKEIQLKKEEYRKLPSIIEDIDFEEPEIPTRNEGQTEWWQDLNLAENPFPGALEGLSSLDKSLFDEIIVATKPIEWTLEKLNAERYDFFHQAFLLAGDFGTGKTTFFDFISVHLIQHHVEPIRIAIMDQITEAHYVQKFEKELCREISKTASKHGIPHSTKLVDPEEMILLMLEMQSRGTKGFFLFLDDLHKNSDRNRVFNFLGQLQIFKNTLRKEAVNMAYFVSGFPGWRDRIKQDSALSGFFDAPVDLSLPEVTPELAAAAITKRLKAFAVNPEKVFAVREDFLRLVFKRESSEIGKTSIGFRPYIKAAVRHFEERKFDILSVDYTSLDDVIASKIRAILEEDFDFKDKIQRLVFGGQIKKKQIREVTLKLLCEVYLRQGIAEEEETFLANKFAFKRLMEVGFIHKANKNGQLVWVISPELRDLNLRIIRNFNLSLEDYLVPIYIGTSSAKQKRDTPALSQSDMFRADLENWRGKIDPVLFAELQGIIKEYQRSLEPYTLIATPKEVSQSKINTTEMKNVVWRLMRTIVDFESPVLLDLPPRGNGFEWSLRHRTLEAVSHFIQMEREYDHTTASPTDIVRFKTFAVDSFDELWRELRTSIGIYTTSLVKPYELPRILLECIYADHATLFRGVLGGKEYFESLSRLVELIERLIRSYLHIACSLSFGNSEKRMKTYPDDIKKYMQKNESSPQSGVESHNEFQSLNRGQYRTLFTQSPKKGEFYRVIIEPVVQNWDSKDIEAFFSLFGDLNIIISHQKATTAEEKTKDIPTFFRLACRLVSGMCENLRALILRNNVVFSDGSLGYVVFGYQFTREREIVRLGSVEEASRIPAPHQWHELEIGTDYDKCSDLMSHSDNCFGDIVIDLLDMDGMRIRFQNQFCNTVARLAHLEANGRIKAYTIYGSELCFRKS